MNKPNTTPITFDVSILIEFIDILGNDLDNFRECIVDCPKNLYTSLYKKDVNTVELYVYNNIFYPFTINNLSHMESSYLIKSFTKVSDKILRHMVLNNGLLLEYIEDPSYKVQLAAVQQTVHALKYIDNPSHNIMHTTVHKSSIALAYIDNPPEKLMIYAMENDKRAIEYIKNPPLSIQLMVIDYMYSIEHPEWVSRHYIRDYRAKHADKITHPDAMALLKFKKL